MKTYIWPDYPSEIDGRLVSKWRGPIYTLPAGDDSDSLDDAVVMSLKSKMISHTYRFPKEGDVNVQFPKELHIHGYEDVHPNMPKGQLVRSVLDSWDTEYGVKTPRPDNKRKRSNKWQDVFEAMLDIERQFVLDLADIYQYEFEAINQQLLEVIVPVELWVQAHPDWMQCSQGAWN